MPTSNSKSCTSIADIKNSLLAVSLMLANPQAFARESGSSTPNFMSKSEGREVRLWLKKHPDYQIAPESFCRCDVDIAFQKNRFQGIWKPEPNFHPYFVEGDFNRDGVQDFAVGVLDPKIPGAWRILIFNGPTSSSGSAAFIGEPLDHDQVLFFDNRPNQNRLLFGRFNDAAFYIFWGGERYNWINGTGPDFTTCCVRSPSRISPQHPPNES